MVCIKKKNGYTLHSSGQFIRCSCHMGWFVRAQSLICFYAQHESWTEMFFAGCQWNRTNGSLNILYTLQCIMMNGQRVSWLKCISVMFFPHKFSILLCDCSEKPMLDLLLQVSAQESPLSLKCLWHIVTSAAAPGTSNTSIADRTWAQLLATFWPSSASNSHANYNLQ